MGRRAARRTVAVGSLAAAVAAAVAAVVAGLGARPAVIAQAQAADTSVVSRSVAFGHARVRLQGRPGGRTCFSVLRGTSTVARACASASGPDRIAYASSRSALGGVAGTEVQAVIVKLTRKGTVWATLRRGAFYADVPPGRRVRAVIKVLRDGSRQRFPVE